jgi:hypothetical protein
MNEISKEAVEAGNDLYNMWDELLLEDYAPRIQQAIDKATAEKDKRIALMEEAGLWQCGRIAEMEKILDDVPHFHTEYCPAPGGDIPSCGHPLSEPYCPRCAWEKIKGLK